MIRLDTVSVIMYAVYTALVTVMIRLGTVRIRMYTVSIGIVTVMIRMDKVRIRMDIYPDSSQVTDGDSNA